MSDLQSTYTIELSLNEALALVAMLRVDVWVGLEFPPDLTESAAQEMVRNGAQSLADRGYLTAGTDGDVYLHAGLLRMARAALGPWVIVSLTPPDGTAPRWLYLSPDMRVEMRRLDEGQLELTAVRFLTEMWQRALEVLGIAATTAGAPMAAFDVDFAALGNVTPEGGVEIKNLLESCGVPQEALQPLTDVLVGRKSFASLRVFDSVLPDTPAEELVWLCGPQGCWLVRGVEEQSDGTRLHFEPVEPEDLHAMVRMRITCPDEISTV